MNDPRNGSADSITRPYRIQDIHLKSNVVERWLGLASMGKLIQGNNVDINLGPDTRAETERLYAALSQGGMAEFPLQEMFRGAYWGSAVDRFGVQWMFNCAAK